MEDKLIEKTEESIKELLEEGEGITTNNLDYIYKLSKIKHMAKEDKNMNYGNYGNYYGNYGRGRYGEYGEGSYGEYNGRGPGHGSYGRRGVDAKYRGDEHLDRMSGEYGRYMESRERYGASQETDKSFEYMVKSLEDFIKYLHEEAETPQHHQMLNEALQRSMR